MGDVVEPSSRPSAQVTPPAMPGLNALLTLAVGVVVVAGLSLAKEVLVPITLAVLLSFVLAPIVELLRRIHLPHVLSVLVAVMLGLGIIGALGAVIGVQIAGLATDVPRYAATIETKVASIRAMTLGRITDLTNRLDRQMQHTGPVQPAPGSASDLAAETGTKKPVPVEIVRATSDPLAIARSILGPILSPLEDALIIFIIAVFILLQKEDLRDRIIRLVGSGDLHRTTVAMDDAARRLSRYFLSQLGINTTFGIVIGVGLAVIGVPSPILWGVLAAILRFVPYVGSVMAAALPAAMAAAVSPDWSMVAWTLGLFLVVESLTGQVVEPLVYGHSTGLSPVAVVIAAIFWAWLWGPIGLILSTPLTLCCVVLGRYVDRLEFLDVLLGDRPALTPVENFYQRMLADDPDEALEQAELVLKDHSLSAYYDEVALKGLQLAANDAQRGVLSTERLERIKRSVGLLIQDLDEHDDRDPPPGRKAEAAAAAPRSERAGPVDAAAPAGGREDEQLSPPWNGPFPVLCLAGRGPLDEAASSMLAQLLRKHGLGARVVGYKAASRQEIARLDIEGVAMVCVSYLEISGSPAALHYLTRRLHKRMPGVPILVGLWPSEAEVLKDHRVRTVIGADHYTTSLREAVETCLAAARRRSGVEPTSRSPDAVGTPP